MISIRLVKLHSVDATANVITLTADIFGDGYNLFWADTCVLPVKCHIAAASLGGGDQREEYETMLDEHKEAVAVALPMPGGAEASSSPLNLSLTSSRCMLNLICPTLMMVVLSWFVFFTPVAKSDRLAYSVTLLLAAMAVQFITADKRPAEQYDGWIDKLMSGAYIMIILPIVETAFLFRIEARIEASMEQYSADETRTHHERLSLLANGHNRIRMVDRICRVAYPIAIVLFLLGLFGPGSPVFENRHEHKAPASISLIGLSLFTIPLMGMMFWFTVKNLYQMGPHSTRELSQELKEALSPQRIVRVAALPVRPRLARGPHREKWVSKDQALLQCHVVLCELSLLTAHNQRMSSATVIDTFTMDQKHVVAEGLEDILAECRKEVETARVWGIEALRDVGSPEAGLAVSLESLATSDVEVKSRNDLQAYRPDDAPIGGRSDSAPACVAAGRILAAIQGFYKDVMVVDRLHYDRHMLLTAEITRRISWVTLSNSRDVSQKKVLVMTVASADFKGTGSDPEARGVTSVARGGSRSSRAQWRLSRSSQLARNSASIPESICETPGMLAAGSRRGSGFEVFGRLLSPRFAEGALLPALALAAAACILGARLAFLPAPAAQPARQHQALLRAGAALAAAAPAAALAEPDELVDYNFAGEFTPFLIIGYFTLTTALTGFSFVSYLVLTKLKII
ncbi:unnamed protein product [Prorocentrum cordatum]|nr:unnamed protein product [Polarella glacialis]